jgi:hypothetical protein
MLDDGLGKGMNMLEAPPSCVATVVGSDNGDMEITGGAPDYNPAYWVDLLAVM